MEQPILHSEIIEIDRTIAGIQKIIKELKNLQAQMQKTAKETIGFQQKQNVSTPGGRAGTEKVSGEAAKLTKENERLAKSIKDVTLEQTKLKKARKDALTEQRRQIQIMGAEKGSLDRNRVALQKLLERYGKTGPAAAKKMEKGIQTLTAKIKQQEEATARHQRSVGNYPKAFTKAKQALLSFGAGMIGATVIIRGMMRAIKNSIDIVLNFDQAMADVAAITRASERDITLLRDAAKALGGSTKFTATEVAGLQKELAKLGFTVSEILAGTGGILALAAATGEDLAQSAEIAGSTLRAFGLEATEMQRVVDVMARGFTGSALTLDKFAVAMRSVGPVAKAFGFTIEETTALLGSLANAGFDASMAGTATRNILLNLADTGGALAKKMGGSVDSFDELIPALIKLRDGGVDLNETLELTDKRSVAAFNRFLEGAEFARKFADELRGAGGAAEEMAEIQLNTLKGDLIILKSAYQGMILEMKDSNTAMDQMARGGTRTLTNMLRRLTKNIIENNEQVGVMTQGMIDLLPANVKAREEAEALIVAEKLLASENEKKALYELAEIERKKKIVALLDAQKKAIIEIAIIDAADRAQAAKDFEELVKRMQAEASAREAKKAIQKKADDDFAAMLAYQMQLKMEVTDNELAADEKAKEDQKAADEKAAADKIRGQEAVVNASANLAFALTDMRMAKLDQEKKAELALAGDNQAKILEIEKKYAKEKQKVAITQALIDSSLAIVKTLASVVFPFNVIAAGIIAATAGVQVAAIRSQTFAEGGHGELGGERHAQGGTPIPGIGEAERGEYFGIINRSMTQKYRKDLPAIFDSLNAGRFHDVWSNANIQLQTEIDP